jgi:hypothetical protein
MADRSDAALLPQRKPVPRPAIPSQRSRQDRINTGEIHMANGESSGSNAVWAVVVLVLVGVIVWLFVAGPFSGGAASDDADIEIDVDMPAVEEVTGQ